MGLLELNTSGARNNTLRLSVSLTNIPVDLHRPPYLTEGVPCPENPALLHLYRVPERVATRW